MKVKKGFGSFQPYNTRMNDTYNVFRIEQKDGNQWLVTNLELEKRGFNTLPQNIEDLATEQILIGFGIKKSSKQCWVIINDNCKPGQIVIGKLSHHPAKAMEKGFAKMHIERTITPAQ